MNTKEDGSMHLNAVRDRYLEIGQYLVNGDINDFTPETAHRLVTEYNRLGNIYNEMLLESLDPESAYANDLRNSIYTEEPFNLCLRNASNSISDERKDRFNWLAEQCRIYKELFDAESKD